MQAVYGFEGYVESPDTFMFGVSISSDGVLLT